MEHGPDLTEPALGPETSEHAQKDGPMKSRLIVALASGALALTMIPAAASAAPPTTGVDVVVSAGTTIYAPAAFRIGSGFPGQTVGAANVQTVEWLSNEYPLYLTAQLSDLVGVTTSTNTIDASDVHYWAGSTDHGSLDTVQNVAQFLDVSDGTLESRSSQDFTLRVFIPSVNADDYFGTLTFGVEVP
jgi:hypothetical protein